MHSNAMLKFDLFLYGVLLAYINFGVIYVFKEFNLSKWIERIKAKNKAVKEIKEAIAKVMSDKV